VDRDRIAAGDPSVVPGACAHHVIDQLKADGRSAQSYWASLRRLHLGVTESGQHFDTIADVTRRKASSDLSTTEVAGRCQAEGKSASLHWEAMFTRSTFQTPDMDAQHRLLNRGRRDGGRQGTIRTTVAETLAHHAANLPARHADDRRAAAMRAKACWRGSENEIARGFIAPRAIFDWQSLVTTRPSCFRLSSSRCMLRKLGQRLARLAHLALEQRDLVQALFPTTSSACCVARPACASSIWLISASVKPSFLPFQSPARAGHVRR